MVRVWNREQVTEPQLYHKLGLSEKNILIYQRFRASDFNGNLQNGNRQFTENKVDMTARFETINGSKYVVYDVFFNNDGACDGWKYSPSIL